MSSNCSEIPIKAYTPLAGGGIKLLPSVDFSQVDAYGHRFQVLRVRVGGAAVHYGATIPWSKYRVRTRKAGG